MATSDSGNSVNQKHPQFIEGLTRPMGTAPVKQIKSSRAAMFNMGVKAAVDQCVTPFDNDDEGRRK